MIELSTSGYHNSDVLNSEYDESEMLSLQLCFLLDDGSCSVRIRVLEAENFGWKRKRIYFLLGSGKFYHIV